MLLKKPTFFLEEQEPVKKIPRAGQKRTGSATLTVCTHRFGFLS